MRILHIIASADPKSGGPIQGLIAQSKFNPEDQREIISADAANESFLNEFPVKIYAKGSLKRDSIFLQFWLGRVISGWPIFFWLMRNYSSYDCIIVNGLWSLSSLISSLVLTRQRQVPYIVFPHGMLDPWFKKTYPLKHAFKWVIWELFERRLLNRSSAVFFTSSEEMAVSLKTFPGADVNSVVIAYGTDQPPPPSPNELGEFLKRRGRSGGGRPYLLFLSRIHKKKGVDILISAFAKIADEYPHIDLVVAGPGDETVIANLSQLVAKMDLQNRVFLTGMLQGDAKWGALRNALGFVLPSHQENFGIAVAEALSVGLPVLISNKINIWREVEEGKAGLVSEDTIGGTENIMRTYLEMTPRELGRMRSNALYVFSNKFDLKNNITSLQAEISAIVKANSANR